MERLFKWFDIQPIRKEHIFPYIVEKYVQYEYERVWYFRALPQPVFRWLEHQLGWHTLVVAEGRSGSPT